MTHQNGSGQPIAHALDEATRAVYKLSWPRSDRARIRYVMRSRHMTLPELARWLGIPLSGVTEHLGPGPCAHARNCTVSARLRAEVLRLARPAMLEHARIRAVTTGMMVHTRARFGYRAVPGGRDEARVRLITQLVRPDEACALLSAHREEAPEGELHRLLQRGLVVAYFQPRDTDRIDQFFELGPLDFVDVDLTA
ncbi:telomere-protecting terminal protein Tpg [Streptomyces sp. NPDC058470]|uniref:telomere-protecting terminal protein Tpg n=1 Tax=Streptomyces sp. NPDC058470 TaxID=3346515 RepID=UPI0036529374